MECNGKFHLYTFSIISFPNRISRHEQVITNDYSSEVEQKIDVCRFRPLHRFYFRTIVGVLCPVVVWAYLIITWHTYLVLANSETGTCTAFGPLAVKYVFHN
jgi:uncharacterized membrane protein YdbT with pleckstrin-like domain